MDSRYDVIVIGAGLQGLAAAKTYLQIEPSVSLLIIDSNETVGGVWAKENIYPGLRSNNLLGTYEYTDFPMTEEFGIKREEHIPGETVYEYFRQYAKKYDLTRRILSRSKARSAEKTRDGWTLTVSNGWLPESDRSQTVTCSKLIVATGITSSPAPINFKGQEKFKAPVINFAHFRQEASHLLAECSCRHVAVYGGSKAAYDAVYMLASKGKHVSWIMRASGHGPTYMAPAHVYLGPFRCWLEKLTTTRILTLFSPCVWGQRDGFGYIRSLMHGTGVGRWLVSKFWSKLTSDLIAQTGLEAHEETKKLIPDQPAFWYANGLSILNYPTNIHDYIKAGQVKIIRKDIECLNDGQSIKFQDGTAIEIDALVGCMGWQSAPNIQFLPESLHSALGIPSATYSRSEQDVWDRLEERADIEILSRFPYLATGPKANPTPPDITEKPITSPSTGEHMQKKRMEFTPWRLWRGIAPPSLPDGSIVFLGMMLNLQGALRAEISSLWAYSYLNERLVNPLATISTLPPFPNQAASHENSAANTALDWTKHGDTLSGYPIQYDTALFNRFGRWRYPMGYGARFPDFVFDGIPYFDLLLRDLGLKSWRKGWGWFGELFGGSYGQEDYRGLVDEWLQSQRQKEGETHKRRRKV